MAQTPFPDFLLPYLDFCQFRKKSMIDGVLNAANFDKKYPISLLLLHSFIRKKENSLPVTFGKEKSLDSFLGKGMNKNEFGISMPIIELPQTRKEANFILDRIQRFCQNGEGLGGSSVLAYLLSEIVDNVYEHSQFSYASVLAGTPANEKFSEICILDNGISIAGSYRKIKRNFTDEEAFQKVLEGVSAKSEERGFGLRTSINLVSKGLNGQFMIISGKAVLLVEKTKRSVYKLPFSNSYKGTIVSIRIPYPSKGINIYEFV
jgi:anti-sigma regulatory factor (Ser/Thr protein kinase)